MADLFRRRQPRTAAKREGRGLRTRPTAAAGRAGRAFTRRRGRAEHGALHGGRREERELVELPVGRRGHARRSLVHRSRGAPRRPDFRTASRSTTCPSTPNPWNLFGTMDAALAQERPTEFHGAQMLFGWHSDAMVGGNPLIAPGRVRHHRLRRACERRGLSGAGRELDQRHVRRVDPETCTGTSCYYGDHRRRRSSSRRASGLPSDWSHPKLDPINSFLSEATLAFFRLTSTSIRHRRRPEAHAGDDRGPRCSEMSPTLTQRHRNGRLERPRLRQQDPRRTAVRARGQLGHGRPIRAGDRRIHRRSRLVLPEERDARQVHLLPARVPGAGRLLQPHGGRTGRTQQRDRRRPIDHRQSLRRRRITALVPIRCTRRWPASSKETARR